MSDPSVTTQGSASDVDEVYRLVDAEQYTRAQKLAEHAPRGEPRWTVARASLTVYTGDGELDDAILSLESLLRDDVPAVLPDHDRALAYALLVRAYGYKRAFAKADAWASRGRAHVGAHVELVLAEARSALWRDDRDRAQALCDEARRIAPESTIARYVSADLAYVAGDFEGCHATLASVPARSPDFLRASRLRAAAYAAVQDQSG